MSDRYNPAAWYWLVGNVAGKVFSSVSAAYVPVDDANYKAWLDADNMPSRILCDGELVDVLLKAGLPPATAGAAGAADMGPSLSTKEIAAVKAAVKAAKP